MGWSSIGLDMKPYDFGQIGPIPLRSKFVGKEFFRPIQKLIFYREFREQFRKLVLKGFYDFRFFPLFSGTVKLGTPVYRENCAKTAKMVRPPTSPDQKIGLKIENHKILLKLDSGTYL